LQLKLSAYMKPLFFFFVAAITIASCKQIDHSKAQETINTLSPESTVVDSANLTSIQWIDSTKNFGKITEGQKLEVSFRFKNIGEKPLIIAKVQPSCGCTVADPPKEPIAPGQEGEIKAAFDSKGRVGTNHKTLYVSANTKERAVYDLTFEVEVIKK